MKKFISALLTVLIFANPLASEFIQIYRSGPISNLSTRVNQLRPMPATQKMMDAKNKKWSFLPFSFMVLRFYYAKFWKRVILGCIVGVLFETLWYWGLCEGLTRLMQIQSDKPVQAYISAFSCILISSLFLCLMHILVGKKNIDVIQNKYRWMVWIFAGTFLFQSQLFLFMNFDIVPWWASVCISYISHLLVDTIIEYIEDVRLDQFHRLYGRRQIQHRPVATQLSPSPEPIEAPIVRQGFHIQIGGVSNDYYRQRGPLPHRLKSQVPPPHNSVENAVQPAEVAHAPVITPNNTESKSEVSLQSETRNTVDLEDEFNRKMQTRPYVPKAPRLSNRHLTDSPNLVASVGDLLFSQYLSKIFHNESKKFRLFQYIINFVLSPLLESIVFLGPIAGSQIGYSSILFFITFSITVAAPLVAYKFYSKFVVYKVYSEEKGKSYKSSLLLLFFVAVLNSLFISIGFAEVLVWSILINSSLSFLILHMILLKAKYPIYFAEHWIRHLSFYTIIVLLTFVPYTLYISMASTPLTDTEILSKNLVYILMLSWIPHILGNICGYSLMRRTQLSDRNKEELNALEDDADQRPLQSYGIHPQVKQKNSYREAGQKNLTLFANENFVFIAHEVVGSRILSTVISNDLNAFEIPYKIWLVPPESVDELSIIDRTNGNYMVLSERVIEYLGGRIHKSLFVSLEDTKDLVNVAPLIPASEVLKLLENQEERETVEAKEELRPVYSSVNPVIVPSVVEPAPTPIATSPGTDESVEDDNVNVKVCSLTGSPALKSSLKRTSSPGTPLSVRKRNSWGGEEMFTFNKGDFKNGVSPDIDAERVGTGTPTDKVSLLRNSRMYQRTHRQLFPARDDKESDTSVSSGSTSSLSFLSLKLRYGSLKRRIWIGCVIGVLIETLYFTAWSELCTYISDLTVYSVNYGGVYISIALILFSSVLLTILHVAIGKRHLKFISHKRMWLTWIILGCTFFQTQMYLFQYLGVCPLWATGIISFSVHLLVDILIECWRRPASPVSARKWYDKSVIVKVRTIKDSVDGSLQRIATIKFASPEERKAFKRLQYSTPTDSPDKTSSPSTDSSDLKLSSRSGSNMRKVVYHEMEELKLASYDVSEEEYIEEGSRYLRVKKFLDSIDRYELDDALPINGFTGGERIEQKEGELILPDIQSNFTGILSESAGASKMYLQNQ